MEWTTRVIVLALFLEFYAHVDQIDDIGSRQQVINEYAWDSSSHMPLYTRHSSGCRSVGYVCSPLSLTCVSAGDLLSCRTDAA